jgi:hypothetical protein
LATKKHTDHRMKEKKKADRLREAE